MRFLKSIFSQKMRVEILLLLLFLLFSVLLMTRTLSTSPLGDIRIASKAWSDFAATVPLIRSFSFGENFPPEYPIFAGPPIRYHFGFFLLVGLLEKIGFTLSTAFNIPSIIGFTLLLSSIYLLGKSIFKSKVVGLIAVIFFLFNGSFSFLEFFELHPLSLTSLKEVVTNTIFPSFGPYDGKIVSAFWNLNIYTNQRHLAFAYFSFIVLIYFFYKFSEKPVLLTYRKAILLGIFVGLFPFIHYAVFGMMGIAIATFFIVYKGLRKRTFLMGTIALALSIPQILYMGKSAVTVEPINPGYLIETLTVPGFFNYWFMNLGLILPLSVLGFVASTKEQRRVFLPFIVLFVVGNIFQVSPEIAANHKFFNLFLIGANILASYFIVIMFKKGLWTSIIATAIFPLLILSGIIDFFPIYNDGLITLSDIPNNKSATFIKSSTPKDSVFLNSSYLYTPASMAGRKIFMGWPYFPWSAGYDTHTRGKMIERIYLSRDKQEICDLLKQNKLDYFTTEDTSENRDFPLIDQLYFRNNFVPDYSDQSITIYSTSKNCNGL